MLAHVVGAGVRALAASIILGVILTYAIGGLDSPGMRSLAKAIVLGFFIFWLVFIFMFGRRVPSRDTGSRSEADAMNFHRTSGRRREEDETNEPAGEGDGGGGGGGD
jgi:hypothetical protein